MIFIYDYKLAIEVDKYDHCDRYIAYEIKRQEAIEKDLGYEFIRIIPDEENFNGRKTISEIYRRTEK